MPGAGLCPITGLRCQGDQSSGGGTTSNNGGSRSGSSLSRSEGRGVSATSGGGLGSRSLALGDSIRWGIFAVASAALAGVLLASQAYALLALVACVLAGSLVLNERALAVALVLSTFLSRFSVNVGGFSVRIEMAISALAWISLILRPKGRRIELFGRIQACLFAWLLLLSVSSIVFAPKLRTSVALLIWLLLDLGALAWLVTRDMRLLKTAIRTGLVATLASQVLGLACWLGASTGSFVFLVQSDPVYGGYASYGTVFEANVFAGLVTLWSIVACSSRVSALVGLKRVRVIIVCLTPLVCIAAHTRTAFVVAILLWVFIALRSSRRFYYILAVPGIAVAVLTAVTSLTVVPGLGKFASPFDFQGGTGGYRANSWAQALVDIKGSYGFWLLGGGLNSFGQRHFDPTLRGTGAPWYLSNLPLDILYDGGVVAVILVGLALAYVLKATSGPTRLFFVIAYVVLGSQASTLWLLQTWVFVALYPFAARPVPLGRGTADSITADLTQHESLRGRA